MIVVIGGPPGGGKTTAAERFAAAHGYVLVSAGLLFREMARDAGMDLAAFGRKAESDASIDRELDGRVLERVLREDSLGHDVVVDGRIQAQLLSERRVPCLKVWIDAPLEVRAKRIAGREGKAVDVAMREIADRGRSERSRYRSIYGIDLDDTQVFDLLIDSSDKAPDEIVALVASRVDG
ncbi:MAG: hypothetical protein A3K59_04470 [Euryarchaeota archaeon RBG_19FT_COMBO_69_17]|nr:MAG: hypothetical protein A3K59_04470 [Euryarchaeota archaeon RBG_19FT_COMBO_69_17]